MTHTPEKWNLFLKEKSEKTHSELISSDWFIFFDEYHLSDITLLLKAIKSELSKMDKTDSFNGVTVKQRLKTITKLHKWFKDNVSTSDDLDETQELMIDMLGHSMDFSGNNLYGLDCNGYQYAIIKAAMDEINILRSSADFNELIDWFDFSIDPIQSVLYSVGYDPQIDDITKFINDETEQKWEEYEFVAE